MAQVLAMIDQGRLTNTLLLQQLVHNTAALGTAAGGNGAANNQPSSKMGEFMRTRPPTFTSAADPLDADDWLRTVESKLVIAQCTDEEKVLYASYQLQGAAAAWWENYQAMLPEGQTLTWAAFKEAFHDAHIPSSIMGIKRRDFYELRQGNQTVMEFLHRFNYLARYAASEIPTEERKIALFRERLNDEMKWSLAAHDVSNFQDLINKAIRVEDSTRAVVESRKRKWLAQKSASGSQPRPRTWQPSNARPPVSPS